MDKVTAIQLSQRLGVDYVVAASLLKLLVAKGVAKESGKIKTSLTGKGKPSTVYEIPSEFTLSLSHGWIRWGRTYARRWAYRTAI